MLFENKNILVKELSAHSKLIQTPLTEDIIFAPISYIEALYKKEVGSMARLSFTTANVVNFQTEALTEMLLIRKDKQAQEGSSLDLDEQKYPALKLLMELPTSKLPPGYESEAEIQALTVRTHPNLERTDVWVNESWQMAGQAADGMNEIFETLILFFADEMSPNFDEYMFLELFELQIRNMLNCQLAAEGVPETVDDEVGIETCESIWLRSTDYYFRLVDCIPWSADNNV